MHMKNSRVGQFPIRIRDSKSISRASIIESTYESIYREERLCLRLYKQSVEKLSQEPLPPRFMGPGILVVASGDRPSGS